MKALSQIFSSIKDCGGAKWVLSGAIGIGMMSQALLASVHARIPSEIEKHIIQNPKKINYLHVNTLPNTANAKTHLESSVGHSIDLHASSTRDLRKEIRRNITVVAHFQASIIGNHVSLNWHTLPHNKLNQIVLERTIDGTNFTKIGVFPANDENNTTQYNDFLETSPLNDQVYYCLFSNDTKNRMGYLGFAKPILDAKPQPIIWLNIEKGLHISLKLNDLKESSVNWTLIDIFGNIASQRNNVNVKNGAFDLELSKNMQLMEGIYLLQVKGTTTAFNYKLIVN